MGLTYKNITYQNVERAVKNSLGLEDDVEIDPDVPLSKIVNERIDPLLDIVPIFHELGMSTEELRIYANEERLTRYGRHIFDKLSKSGEIPSQYREYFGRMANENSDKSKSIGDIANTLTIKGIYYLRTTANDL